MAVFVALLRGINVGGHRKVPMADLRETVEAAGFGAPATYVQSGNLVMKAARGDGRAVEKTLAKAIADRFGFEVPVVARDLEQWQRIVRENPFEDAVQKPATLHAFILSRPAAREAEGKLAERERADEDYRLAGDVLYLSTPSGLGRSKFAASVERLLGVPATARNWNTMLKLEAMATDLDAD